VVGVHDTVVWSVRKRRQMPSDEQRTMHHRLPRVVSFISQRPLPMTMYFLTLLSLSEKRNLLDQSSQDMMGCKHDSFSCKRAMLFSLYFFHLNTEHPQLADQGTNIFAMRIHLPDGILVPTTVSSVIVVGSDTLLNKEQSNVDTSKLSAWHGS
jgi:hypothetical protein